MVVAKTIMGHPFLVKSDMVNSATDNLVRSTVFGVSFKVTNNTPRYDDENPSTHREEIVRDVHRATHKQDK